LSSFNPRARDEREVVKIQYQISHRVSIHALVMSAKIDADTGYTVTSVSIHALVMSAKKYQQLAQNRKTGFNPRARDEREQNGGINVRDLGVSIHALVMSAKLT